MSQPLKSAFAWKREESRSDLRRLREETGEHLAIAEALQAGDRREAADAMARHIRSGARYWARAIPTFATAADRPRRPKKRSAP